jgi:hypothetical protein
MTGDLLEVIILDTDNSVVRQSGLIKKYDATILPLALDRSNLRYFCSDEKMEELIATLASAARTDKPKAVFYGSGDYHNLAHAPIKVAMRGVDFPVAIVHFDNHTDWWRYRSGYHFFGNWVARALQLPHIAEVYQFGIDGDLAIDEHHPWESGPLHHMELLLDGRVELYPRNRKESLLKGHYEGHIQCGDIIAGPGPDETRIRWKNFSDEAGLKARLEDVLSRMSAEAVYISVDKDALAGDQNFSGYGAHEGFMLLSELAHAIEMVAATKRVIGIDICGDGSPHGTHTDEEKIRYSTNTHGVDPADFTNETLMRLGETANLEILGALERGSAILHDRRRAMERQPGFK